MSAIAGAAGGAAAAAANAAGASSVASSNQSSSSIMNVKRVFYKRIDYHTKSSGTGDSYNGELLIQVDDGEESGRFWHKRVTKLVPLPEGIRRNLPEGAKILYTVIDWHAERVRVYYTF